MHGLRLAVRSVKVNRDFTQSAYIVKHHRHTQFLCNLYAKALKHGFRLTHYPVIDLAIIGRYILRVANHKHAVYIEIRFSDGSVSRAVGDHAKKVNDWIESCALIDSIHWAPYTGEPMEEIPPVLPPPKFPKD